MTAEILLVLILAGATVLISSLGALLLAAFGPTGWFVILAIVVAALLVWRVTSVQLAARSDWLCDDLRDDLRDDWRAG